MSPGIVPLVGVDLVVLALGIACLLWGFAGTRFTRIVAVCARHVVRYGAIAAVIYVLGASTHLWGALGAFVDGVWDGFVLFCTVLVRLFTIEIDPVLA